MGDMADFQVYEQRKSGKEHKCDMCGAVIAVGDKYQINKGVDDGTWFKSKECLTCQPVIREFMNADYNGGDGYCDDWVQEWWRDNKCTECRHEYPVCKPDIECSIHAKVIGDRCADLDEYGRCTGGDACDDMTHYCRCEKFEPTVLNG